jgi:hypothetical protein
MVTFVGMGIPNASYALKGVERLTPLRALVLQSYYGLRRFHEADRIGTSEVRAWIRSREPGVERPSGSLVRSTLLAAGVPHRKEGRPRRGTALRIVPAFPPLFVEPPGILSRR